MKLVPVSLGNAPSPMAGDNAAATDAPRPSVSALPPLYAAWVDQILCGPLPEEPHATCADCAMCKPPGAAATASVERFNSRVKCCTYVPTLWNFLVGRIVGDSEPTARAGRDSVMERIARRAGTTPLGLQPSSDYWLIYKYANHTATGLFGRNEALLCPHYLAAEGGLCGIWRNRNAVCATFFCKFQRGAVGQAFWDTLLQLLTTTERELALWCAGQLGEEPEKLGATLLPYFGSSLRGSQRGREPPEMAVDDPPPHVWHGRWTDRIPEFYLAAAQLVQPLSWQQVLGVCGPEVGLQAQLVRQSYDSLQSPPPPGYLRLGAIGIQPIGGGTSAVAGYSDRDMLVLPTEFVDALFCFDGRRATDDVLQELAAVHGVSVDEATLRKLIDFGILTPMRSIAMATG